MSGINPLHFDRDGHLPAGHWMAVNKNPVGPTVTLTGQRAQVLLANI